MAITIEPGKPANFDGLSLEFAEVDAAHTVATLGPGVEKKLMPKREVEWLSFATLMTASIMLRTKLSDMLVRQVVVTHLGKPVTMFIVKDRLGDQFALCAPLVDDDRGEQLDLTEECACDKFAVPHMVSDHEFA